MQDENGIAEGEGVVKAKVSKLAVVSLVLGFLSMLCIGYKYTAPPAIVLGVISLVMIKKSKGGLRGKRLAIAGIAIPVVFYGFIILWSFDAPPIENDYTVVDLRSAPVEYNRSFDVLLQLSKTDDVDDGGSSAIGLNAEDDQLLKELLNEIKMNEGNEELISNFVLDRSEDIERLWERSLKGREVIYELDEYEEIADLTEPDLYDDLKYLGNLKDLFLIYRLHVYLQCERGNSRQGIVELIKIDSVFRKLKVNGRSLIAGLVYTAGIQVGFQSANYIANHPNTSNEALKMLAEHFEPLNNEELSLRNTFISEYLMFRRLWGYVYKINENIDIEKWKSRPAVKTNSTFRLYRNLCDRYLRRSEGITDVSDELSVWPEWYPELGEVDVDLSKKAWQQLPWYYMAYNPVGSMLSRTAIIVVDKIIEFKTKLEVRDDLLQVVISKRLGRWYSLAASAYSDEYVVDVEKGMIFSCGPDGVDDTKDDIKLYIRPAVLGFSN